MGGSPLHVADLSGVFQRGIEDHFTVGADVAAIRDPGILVRVGGHHAGKHLGIWQPIVRVQRDHDVFVTETVTGQQPLIAADLVQATVVLADPETTVVSDRVPDCLQAVVCGLIVSEMAGPAGDRLAQQRFQTSRQKRGSIVEWNNNSEHKARPSWYLNLQCPTRGPSRARHR